MTEVHNQKDAARESENSDNNAVPDALHKTVYGTAPANFTELVAAGKHVLTKIEPSGAPISLAQLTKAMQDGSFTGQEAQATAALYLAFPKLASSPKGLSAGDLDKLPQLAKKEDGEFAQAKELKQWADSRLSHFIKSTPGSDADVISQSQISKALNDTTVSQSDKKFLKELEQLIPTIGVPSSDNPRGAKQGLRLSDIDKYANDDPSAIDNFWYRSDRAQMIKDIRYAVSHTGEAESLDLSHNLYATADPLKSIKSDAVRQGWLGDCIFESALAAIADSNPQLIQDAIKDNHDGTYTVTFPGAKDFPITAKAPTYQEQGLFNHASKDGIWASVMEKAYGQLVEQAPQSIIAIDQATSNPWISTNELKSKGEAKKTIDGTLDGSQNGSEWTSSDIPLNRLDVPHVALAKADGLLPANYKNLAPQEYVGGPGAMDEALTLLSGKKTTLTDLSPAWNADPVSSPEAIAAKNERIARLLETAMSSSPKLAVITGSDSSSTVAGIIPNHAYTVTNFKSDGHGGGTVSLRNPHANDFAPSYPEFLTMSLSDFATNFSTVAND